jgi:hypothetical protein
LGTLYRARWKDATQAERAFLIAMANVGDTDIAGALGVSTGYLSESRDRLITKGIIRATAYGRLGFTISGFADYLRAQQVATTMSTEP